MASGFLPGEFNPRENAYQVRQRDKHVWAEVFFPTVGWVEFDATQGAEDISDRSSKNKGKGFFAWLFAQGGTTLLVGLCCALLLGYVLKTELWDRWMGRQRPQTETLAKPATNLAIVAAYAEVSRLLAKRGLHRPPHLTPIEFAREVTWRSAETLPALGLPLDTLTTLFTRFRYSAEEATEEEVHKAQEASAAIRQILQESKRGAIARSPLQSPT
jgi:hypothetical protein